MAVGHYDKWTGTAKWPGEPGRVSHGEGRTEAAVRVLRWNSDTKERKVLAGLSSYQNQHFNWKISECLPIILILDLSLELLSTIPLQLLSLFCSTCSGQIPAIVHLKEVYSPPDTKACPTSVPCQQEAGACICFVGRLLFRVNIILQGREEFLLLGKNHQTIIF